VRIQVRCFAAVRELLGDDLLELDVPDGTTLGGLADLLVARAPELARIDVAYARNLDYAPPEQVLAEGDEIALIPPISGGADLPRFAFRLQRDAIDPRVLEQQVRTDQDGAIATFAGVTRDHHQGRAVAKLEYEAYPAMAERTALRLLDEAGRRFAIGRARIVHRLGPVAIGEASIAVVVAAPHRAPAFAACAWLMDRIKAELPVFKREQLADGSTRWVGAPPQPDAGGQRPSERR
jgi:molybdopterin synthase catalytic subunit